MKQAEGFIWLTLQPLRWRWDIPPKCRLTVNGPQQAKPGVCFMLSKYSKMNMKAIRYSEISFHFQRTKRRCIKKYRSLHDVGMLPTFSSAISLFSNWLKTLIWYCCSYKRNPCILRLNIYVCSERQPPDTSCWSRRSVLHIKNFRQLRTLNSVTCGQKHSRSILNRLTILPLTG
jgi:hypothetical protein